MAEPTLIERLTELANQLGGHAGPSDTVELSEFLTKCEKEAFAIATELHRLERHSLPGGAARIVGHTRLPWGIEYTASTLWLGPLRPDGGKVDEIVMRFDVGEEHTPEHNVRQRANAELVVAAVNAASPPPPSVWMDRTALEIAVQNRHGMIVNVKDLSDTWRRVAERLETEKQAVETEREACAKALRG